MSDTLQIPRLNDLHVHLRDDELMRVVTPYTAAQCHHALVMPNLTPPILTAADAASYRRRIVEAAGDRHFTPLLTVKLTQAMTAEIVAECMSTPEAGVVAAKLYPEGVTTNSEDGVSDIRALGEVLEAMQQHDMVLCLHGESPGDVFCLDREDAFVDTDFRWLVETFPRLRIVLEHITTAKAVEAVKSARKGVAATITAHHLWITLDDVVGNKLEPHNFCKPIAKRPQDRAALLAAATGGDARFFLGSDTAPHAREAKECAGGCAGVFTGSHLAEYVATVFEAEGALDRLAGFTSAAGAAFYRLPPSEHLLTLERRTQVVQAEGPVVPFLAGTELPWSCAGA